MIFYISAQPMFFAYAEAVTLMGGRVWPIILYLMLYLLGCIVVVSIGMKKLSFLGYSKWGRFHWAKEARFNFF